MRVRVYDFTQNQHIVGKEIMKLRQNFSLTTKAADILEKAAKMNGGNKSKIINQLIIQKLTDPRERLRDRARELAQELHNIQEQLQNLGVE